MRTAGIILTAIFMMNMMMETQANERKTVRSKLDEVTVFFHGAELKHSAEIALTQGENEVWIEGLSTQIDAGSLNIRAGAGIVISAYEFVPAHVSEHISDPVLRKLRDSLVMYQKKGQQIDIEMKAVLRQSEIYPATLKNAAKFRLNHAQILRQLVFVNFTHGKPVKCSEDKRAAHQRGDLRETKPQLEKQSYASRYRSADG